MRGTGRATNSRGRGWPRRWGRSAPRRGRRPPALGAALKAGDEALRRAAALALWQIEGKADDTLPVLIDWLADPGGPLWPSWADEGPVPALGEMGAAAREAVPVMVEVFKAASRPEEGKPYPWSLRPAIVRALGRLGREAKEAVPALRAAREDANAVVRCSAALALWQITGEAGEALVILRKELRDPTKEGEPDVAVGAVAAMGPVARDALPTLLDLLRDGNGVRRVEVAGAVLRIDPENKGALAVRTRSLGDRRAVVRELAAEAAGRLEVQARPLIAALRAATDDTELAVRSAARQALRQIEAGKDGR